ncbi:MAG: UDP-N-acetylmuramoyl-tripeptide--D-alanyl-D-alanine ligase [Spirochaetaceae bacterium]|nr:MAG: UDP-N-acetylmuramoyl-tripeptide--D-alanyl-D-alanine ligase [Spirochaetaceae bacterium]
MGLDRLSIRDICSITGARHHGASDQRFSSIVVDSREVTPGALFVALPGERTDGHHFVEQALDSGAAGALVARSARDRYPGPHAVVQMRADKTVLEVAGTLPALQAMAAAYRDLVESVTVVGITGSNGKTTTKELIGAVVQAAHPAFVTRGNLNSDIGLPLSLFCIEPEHRYAVLEMGMNRVGEMQELARMARPDVAVITNIGTAHIGNIGSIEGIAEEKKAITSEFSGSERLLIWEDEPQFKRLARNVRGTVEPYGPRSTSGWERFEDHGVLGSTLYWRGRTITLSLCGAHSVRNALAAIHVGLLFGIGEEAIVSGIESVQPLFGRGQILRGRTTTILDCYNANPESMGEALRLLSSTGTSGRRIAVLGAMKELGELTDGAHRSVVALAMGMPLDRVFLVGKEFEDAAPVDDTRFRYFDGIEELSAALPTEIRGGDTVLIKGSRSLALERIVPQLEAEGE